MSSIRKIAIATLLVGIGSPFVLADAPPLVAEAPIPVSDTKGGFDFIHVDEANGRLLAAHTGNGTLDVFDLADGKLLKHVPTGSAQDVAVDAAAGKYYVSVSEQKKIVIVDGKNLAVEGEVPLDGPADAVALDAKNHLLYVGHDDEKNLWLVDPSAKKVTGSIAIAGAGPEVIVYDEKSGRLFQNIKTNDTVAVIDAKTRAITATWSTAPAKGPHGLACNPETKHLFTAGANGKLAVIDTGSGKMISSEDIAKSVDQIVFDPATKRVYCGCGSGKISVLEDGADGVKSLGNVTSSVGARNIVCDPKTHAVWTAYVTKDGCFIQRFRME